MAEFERFPKTPHLCWLGQGEPRDDKVLVAPEAADFLTHTVIVEEKVDGANLGFSVDDDGVLQAQNRGNYLAMDALAGQWKPLRGWLQRRNVDLAGALFPSLMLFGEWCYAVHSLRYTDLPDWFLVFDVFDRVEKRFWSSERRDALAAELGFAVVPGLGSGRFTIDDLLRISERSRLRAGSAEGVYLRREEGGALVTRAKLVRPEFVQAIGDHWSGRMLETNGLRAGP
ncbi:MAG: RNA ligase family protein [Bauldia sp.]